MIFIPTKTKMTQKGQVTIPKKVREYLGVGKKNQIEFRINKGSVIIRPAISLEANFGKVKPRKRPENFKVVRQEVIKKMAKKIAKE